MAGITRGDMARMKLRGRIVEKFGTMAAFAAAAGISKVTVSNVLRGKTDPQKKKMHIWCELLDIRPEEKLIFFWPESSEN